MPRDQFTFRAEYLEAIVLLKPKEQNAVIRAVCEYALNDIEPVLEGSSLAVFSLMRHSLDVGKKRAENRIKAETKRKQNDNKIESNEEQIENEKGEKEGRKKGEKESSPHTPYKEKDPKKGPQEKEQMPRSSERVNGAHARESEIPAVRDDPPTVQEVEAFCRENGYKTDPARFHAYYAARGWMCGDNPMLDWRAALRSWVAFPRNGEGEPESIPSSFDSQAFFEAALSGSYGGAG